RVVSQGSKDGTDPAKFPSVPEDVQLLCRDPLFYDKTVPSTSDKPGIDNSVEKNSPAVLLSPTGDGSRDFTFDILPPVLDIYTWNRCVADIKQLDASRASAWNDFFSQAKAGINARPLELYDPAVKSIVVEVDGSVVGNPVDVPKEYGPQVRIRIECGAPAQAPPPGLISVPVSPNDGEVKKIEIYLVLDPDQLKRFERLESLAELDANNRLHVFTAFVERATTKLPSAHELWANTRISQSSSTGEIRAELALANDGSSNRFVGKIQFLRQVWRWNGRPVEDFFDLRTVSDAEQKPQPPELLAWEAEEFGWRSDDDYLKVSARRVKPTSNGGAMAVYREDVASDTRALYMRFGILVTSRYEGVIGSGKPSSTLDSALFLERWRRIFIKSRRSGSIPTPKVVHVLPLTEPARPPDSAAEHQPGLLAIVAEPWFQIGGLAERMEVDTAVTAKRLKEPQLLPLREFGPDPISTADACAVDSKKNLWSDRAGLIGPVGHTFDTQSDDPLFVSSSFIIRPPDIKDCGDGGDFSWYFIKLKFRRTLLGRYLEPLPGAPSDTIPSDLVSEDSEAHWSQYLPGFSHWKRESGTDADVSELEARPAAGSSSRFAIMQSGVVFVPKASTSSSGTFAIVTAEIVDASGLDAESYVGAALMTANKQQWTLLSISGAGADVSALPGKFRVRLIEVQLPLPSQDWLSTIHSEIDLWNGLFGNPDSRNTNPQQTKDASARIVRVSKYFSSAVSVNSQNLDGGTAREAASVLN
ncbi:MAG TPA: hypothetical protein VJX67_26280, partial [Blastocatellia bacterium]|nr:hypothetical protein [Blastocatellia bacterium]